MGKELNRAGRDGRHTAKRDESDGELLRGRRALLPHAVFVPLRCALTACAVLSPARLPAATALEETEPARPAVRHQDAAGCQGQGRAPLPTLPCSLPARPPARPQLGAGTAARPKLRRCSRGAPPGTVLMRASAALTGRRGYFRLDLTSTGSSDTQEWRETAGGGHHRAPLAPDPARILAEKVGGGWRVLHRLICACQISPAMLGRRLALPFAWVCGLPLGGGAAFVPPARALTRGERMRKPALGFALQFVRQHLK